MRRRCGDTTEGSLPPYLSKSLGQHRFSDMDIHRCRFVPYPPAAINAIAFSHPPAPAQKTPRSLRLALGRANGDIEIWNPNRGNWFQEIILRGGNDRSIEGLAWTEDPADDESQEGGRVRLFSIGFSSSVTEWDLERGTTLRHANGNYGEIWCFAAQPKYKRKDNTSSSSTTIHDNHPQSQYIAAGCADGNILLFSTEDGDLRFSKVIGAPPTKKPRVLSIAWKNRNVVVAGYSDGTLRLYDIRARKLLRNMTLGKSTDGSNEILVWAVTCLPDETIISGDSAGEIKIWDSHNYSLVQRIQAHQADVLDIVASADGEMLMSGGADRRTVAFKLGGSKKSGKLRRWAEIMHRKFHEHDVKTIATFESTDLSVLVSGGLDTVPVVAPLRGWQNKYHRTLSNLPRQPQVCSAPTARLLVSWWDREVSIWQIHNKESTSDQSDSMTTPGVEKYKLLSKILLTGDENITSATISTDGQALAVSTSASVKLFQLKHKQNLQKLIVKVKSVELPERVEAGGARLVQFSPDGHWLASVRSDNSISLLKIHRSTYTTERISALPTITRLRRRRRKLDHPHTSSSDPTGKYEKTILNIAFSHDSRILAVGDISGCIDCWVLEGNEDLMDATPTRTNGHSTQDNEDDSSDDSSNDEAAGVVIEGQQWIHSPVLLPSLGSPVLTLSFRPSKAESQSLPNDDIGLHATRQTPHPHSHTVPVQEDRLVAVTAQHHVVEFEGMKGRLSDWSRRNPSAYLPEAFTVIKDRVMACFWDVRDGHERLYLYGPMWIFMLEMSQDLPEGKAVGRLGHHEVVKPNDSVLGKRKWSPSELAKHRNTGAGDAMPVSESYVGLGSKMVKYHDQDQDQEGGIPPVQTIDLDDQRNIPSKDDEDDEALNTDLASLRRQPISSGEDEHAIEGTQTTNGHTKSSTGGVVEGKENRRGWWYTYNYRSILGITPIYIPGSIGNDDEIFEVAIVERPLWDVDLPPRYDERQD